MRTSIFTHFYWGERKENDHGNVVIEKNSFIGPHCVILPNVRIGEGAVIKAGTVVTRDVPPYTFWGSPPAEPIGKVTIPLTREYSYEEFVKGLKPIRKKKHWNNGKLECWNNGTMENWNKGIMEGKM